MKSDVKAVRVTGTGTVFAGRTRLRGLILASDGGGAGDVFAFNIPEDGVVFPGGMKVSTITNIAGATFLIDK